MNKLNVLKKSTFLKCSVLTLAAVTGVGLLGATNLTKTNSVYASSNFDDFNKVSISNANFSNSSSVTGYKLVNRSHEATSISDSDLYGILDLNSTSYPKNPISTDSKVLKLSSKLDESAFYGYQMENAMTINANSAYLISADVYSVDSANNAALYLIDENSEVFAKKEYIGSNNQWTSYYFLVKTNEYTSLKLKLEMQIAGEGTVLFDNLSCYEISTQQYNKLATTHASDIIDKSDAFISSINMNLRPFTSVLPSDATAMYCDSSYEDAVTNSQEVNDGSNNSEAFRIYSGNKTFTKYETNDNFLTFNRNSLTKVTVSLKTINLSGKVTLKLIQTNLDEDEDGIDSNSLTISSNTSNKITNDYSDYSFYVLGSPVKDVTYKLVVTLGESSSSTASGIVYVSKVNTYKANYSTYSSVSTGTNAEKVNAGANYSISGKTNFVDNAFFNGIEILDYTQPTLPAQPTNWTISDLTNNQECGVVDLNNNNVLMLHNKANENLKVTSATKSLSTSTLHRFSLDVLTKNCSAKISLVSTINNKEVVLKSYTLNTDYAWKTVAFTIQTAYQNLDVSIRIESDEIGYVYCDNAMFDYYTTPSTLEDLDNDSAYNYDVEKVSVDLTNVLQTEESNSKKPLETNFFSLNNEDVKAGILNLNNIDDDYLKNYYVGNANAVAYFRSVNNKNIIYLRANDLTSFEYTSNLGYTLSANKYYTLSFKIYTQGLESENEEELGAFVKMTGFEDYIKNVVTTNSDSNGWREYTIYLNPTEDITSYFQIGLGSSEVKAMGSLFVADINFNTAEESDFNTISENNYIVLKDLEKAEDEDKEEETNEEENEDESTKSSNNSAWLYYVPTIASALTIVIAIVGVMLRKINWRKPVKKSKNTYDRNRQDSRQLYSRKATTLREAKIASLTKEIQKLSDERKEFEDNYKQDLSKLRKLKINRADKAEISNLEREMKKNQKYSASLGVNLNKLELELEHCKTDMYLNSLIKKLMNNEIDVDENEDE